MQNAAYSQCTGITRTCPTTGQYLQGLTRKYGVEVNPRFCPHPKAFRLFQCIGWPALLSNYLSIESVCQSLSESAQILAFVVVLLLTFCYS